MVARGDPGDVGRVEGNCGSNGLSAYFQCVEGEGNARATMTFGVVNAVFPFGNPAGYQKPDGLR